jgi:ubiquinone/menaquinone biosynthesis C-methylase UbiE
MSETIKLSDAQLAPFDVDRVVGPRWERIRSCIDRDFPDGRFTFLDVGGGNGTFADRLLATYPHCSGTVLDNSEMLVSRNVKSDRKRVVLASATELEPYGRHDIVFCNTLLHHLVGLSYDATRGNIARVIASASRTLTERGRLSIYEVDCNGVIDGFSSRLLFWLTSSRVLAPAIKSLGANTAGSVCATCPTSNGLRFWMTPGWPSPPTMRSREKRP